MPVLNGGQPVVGVGMNGDITREKDVHRQATELQRSTRTRKQDTSHEPHMAE